MCFWALLPFRPVVKQYCNTAYDRCSHFLAPELPFPDRIRWDASNMSALKLIYLLIRSKEVGLFFIANVKVRFLGFITKWKYNIGLKELSYVSKPSEIETGKWTLHVKKEQYEILRRGYPDWVFSVHFPRL